jgi:uncharacterized membrane protein
LLGLSAAIGTAIAKSATDIGTKFASTTIDERPLLAIQWTVGAIVLIFGCLIWYPGLVTAPRDTFASLIGLNFWWVLILNGFLNAIAFFFYVRAFRYADASLVAPIMLFTPIFLLVTSPLILGEQVSFFGAIGVVVTVAGSYFLGKSLGGDGAVSSLVVLARNKGVQSMFVTACIWSITSNLDKIGVQSAPILLWSASITTVIAFYSILFWAVMPKSRTIGGDVWRAMIPGVTNAAGYVLQMYALTILFVPYVIAIKRMSAILTVLVSGLLFREKIGTRMTGVACMVTGALMMIFGG